MSQFSTELPKALFSAVLSIKPWSKYKEWTHKTHHRNSFAVFLLFPNKVRLKVKATHKTSTKQKTREDRNTVGGGWTQSNGWLVQRRARACCLVFSTSLCFVDKHTPAWGGGRGGGVLWMTCSSGRSARFMAFFRGDDKTLGSSQVSSCHIWRWCVLNPIVDLDLKT